VLDRTDLAVHMVALSRNELLDAAWDAGQAITERAADVYVLRLRQSWTPIGQPSVGPFARMGSGIALSRKRPPPRR
jgi:hypothetical protein